MVYSISHRILARLWQDEWAALQKWNLSSCKTAKYIDDGDQMKALKNIFSFPLQLNKMKLILRLILPKEIMQKIRKFR